jgi:hypothetical protein
MWAPSFISKSELSWPKQLAKCATTGTLKIPSCQKNAEILSRMTTLCLVKKDHLINSTVNHPNPTFHILISAAFTKNLVITMSIHSRRRNFSLMILDILLISAKKNNLEKQSQRAHNNSVKSFAVNKTPEFRKIYLITCTLSVKAVSERFGKLNIRKQKINTPWNKCLNLCKYLTIQCNDQKKCAKCNELKGIALAV